MPLPTPTVQEQYDQRTLGIAADGSDVGKRVFLVKYADFGGASAAEVDEIDTHVLASVGINRWDAYPGRPLVLAQSVDVSNAGDQFRWWASYGYSSKAEASNGQGATAAELQADGLDTATSGAASSPAGGDRAIEAESRPFQIRSIKRTVSEPLEYDGITGNRLTNTAGDPFDPPPMVERSYLGYEVTWYKYPANLRWAAPLTTPPFGRPDYIDSVNNVAFKVFKRTHPARTLRVADVSFALQWDKGPGGLMVPVVELKAELLSKPGGWKRSILNAGRRELTAAGEPLRPILDATGQPVADPYPLNAVGAKLTVGNPLVYVDCYEYTERNLIELFQ